MMTKHEEPKSLIECLEKLKEKCQLMYDEYDYSENYSIFNPPATEDQIKETEDFLGVKFPEDYRQFLKFTNGAKILGTYAKLYGLNRIGVEDPMVPDGYYTVGEEIGDGQRIAISKTDGKLYSCYCGTITSYDIFHEMSLALRVCEDEIQECVDKINQSKKSPEEIRKEEEEYEEYILHMKKLLEERRDKKDDN